MGVRLYPLVTGLLFWCVGCAIRQPLLVPDQAKLINNETKVLKPYAEITQTKISAAGLTAALVILKDDRSTSPIIIPTRDPVATAVDHPDDLKGSSLCFIVYARSLPLSPEELSCEFLVAQASSRLETRRVADEQQTRLNDLLASENALKRDLVILRSDLTTSSAEVRALSDTLKQQQVLLEQQATNGVRSKADIEKLAAVVAPTASLVRFHEAQLRNTEEVLNHLINQYTSVANAIGQNNQQIDSMIKEINSSFAQVKGTLDQMQQKLSTIK